MMRIGAADPVFWVARDRGTSLTKDSGMRISRRQGSCGSRLVVTIAASLLVAVGCAGGSARSIPHTADDRPLPRPSEIFVYDFSVDADDVVLDTFGPNFVREEASASERASTGRSVAALLSERIVVKLGERGIRARRASGSTPVPVDALAVKGQFVKISEGDQIGRMVIGFGVGGEKLRAWVQVYQMTESGLRQISAGEGEAHSRRTPGVAGPAAAGAATGMVVGTVISAGMNIGSELAGGMKARVDDLAENFANRAVEFYEQHGWRLPEMARP